MAAAHLRPGQKQLLETFHLFTVVCCPLLDKRGDSDFTHLAPEWGTRREGLRVGERKWGTGSGLAHRKQRDSKWGTGTRYHEDAEHHVVVVDEEDELIPPGGELGGHLQDKVFHLHLHRHRVSQQASNHTLARSLTHTHTHTL